MSDPLLYLALGSNLGNRSENLAEARRRLAEHLTLLRHSHIYETPPWGVLDQPAFYNQVVEARTTLAPLALLQQVKQIEVEMGRVPSVRYGPRLIDIDLLLYGTTVLKTETLTLPHPRMTERAFVLVPLRELAPDLIPPESKLTISELSDLQDTGGIHRLEDVNA